MTSPTIDHDGIERVVSAAIKMDSLDANVISDTEWQEFASKMKILDPRLMKAWPQSYNPKLVRQLFSSDMVTRNLHKSAKLGKIDVMKVLLSLGRTDVNKIDNAGWTALHYAAREGHLDIVTMLLEEQNIDTNLRDLGGYTALHYAAMHGQMLVFDMLLKDAKAEVNNTNNSGETALILAARGGHEKISDMLLKVPNVKVTSKDHKSTPLHAAAEHGHAVIVEMLLPRMDVNSTNKIFKQSPLHLAVQGGHENVVHLLLQVPTVKPSLKDSESNTPLHIASEKGNEVIFGKLLQRHEVQVDVNATNNTSLTALHFAAKYKHTNIVMKLLDVPNIDPCPKTEDGKTPLHMVVMSGGADVVQLLLGATGKVDVNITDSKKRTAIHWATEHGHLNVVDVLLGVSNVDPCLGDENEDTPLHLAAKLGHPSIVESLLDVTHLNVNKVNKQNETPLFLASRFGSIDVVDLLLENPEVSISICNNHGDSPFDIAILGNHTNIAQKLITHPRAVSIFSIKTTLNICIKRGYENFVDILLKQSTVNAGAKDDYGNFPIHYAVQNGNISIIQMILHARGVNVNSVNDHLDTVLHIAVRAGHDDVVYLLLQVPTLNVNMRDWDGNSALHLAVKYGEEHMVEMFLRTNYVDVNVKGKHGVTALELAAEEGHELIVDKLWAHHVSVNNDRVGSEEEGQGESSNKDWGTRSLLLAARNGHDTIIQSLLKHGVDVNGTHSAFKDGTALSEAIEYGHPKVVEVLLKDPNINPDRRNELGQHVLFLAARDGREEIVQKLMATKQIGVNVLSLGGETALHGAASGGREQVVEILLETPGIDVHVRNGDGETALFYAARANNKTILKAIYNASKDNVGSKKHTVQAQMNINDVNNDGESIIHLAAQKNLLNVIDFLLEVTRDDASSVHVNLQTSPPKMEEGLFKPKSALRIAIEKKNYSLVEKLIKFDNVGFAQEVDDTTIFQLIYDQGLWEIYDIVKRTPEVTDYIDGLYKDRQASVDAANAILVGGALIAGVTFASWLQTPLGYATYYHEQFSDSLPAPPVAYPEYAAFDHHPSLQAFWVFNSLSFFSAIATVISGAQSVLPSRKLFIKQEVEYLRWNLLKTSILLGFSMFFVLLAFATAGVVVLPPMMKFRSNIFSTIGIGGSLCFMFLFSFWRNIYKLGSNIKRPQPREQVRKTF